MINTVMPLVGEMDAAALTSVDLPNPRDCERRSQKSELQIRTIALLMQSLLHSPDWQGRSETRGGAVLELPLREQSKEARES